MGQLIYYWHCDARGSTYYHIFIFKKECRRGRGGELTRAPLGYFYNAPHWKGGYFEPPSDLRNYWTDSKNSSGIKALEKLSREKQILLTSGSRVTSQVRSK